MFVEKLREYPTSDASDMLWRLWVNSFWRISRCRLSSASLAFLARISSRRCCMVDEGSDIAAVCWAVGAMWF